MIQHATARRTLCAIAIGLAATGAHAQLLGGLGGSGAGSIGGNLGGSLTGGPSIPAITQMRTIDATRGAVGSIGQAARQDAAALSQVSPNFGVNGNAGANASGNANGNAGANNSGLDVGGLNAGADGGSGGGARGGNASPEPTAGKSNR